MAIRLKLYTVVTSKDSSLSLYIYIKPILTKCHTEQLIKTAARGLKYFTGILTVKFG